MIFLHRWLNKYTIHWQWMIIHELWNSIIFLNFKTSLVITTLPPTSSSRIAYENRYVTHPLPIFNSYLFNRIKIVPICARESSKPSLIKRRIEYLTKALLVRFSKTIMFFKFLLEKVSRRFENDFIHETEYFWSVNIDKIGPILAVYCV